MKEKRETTGWHSRRAPEQPFRHESSYLAGGEVKAHRVRRATPERGHPSEDEEVRVLISFGMRHLSYGSAFASAIRSLRPWTRVALAAPEEVDELLGPPGPHLIITDRPGEEIGVGGAARLEISTDPRKPSRFSVENRLREVSNPSLDEILALVDEVARLVGEKPAGGRDA